MTLKFYIIILFLPFSGFTQPFKINAQYEIESPRIKILYTSIDEVINHFGKDYTTKREFTENKITYPNGLSFTYIYTDKNKLVRAYFIDPPAQAIDAYGVELNKTTVREVLQKFYGRKINYSYGKWFVHTKYMNYTFTPDPKYRNGYDSNAVITGFDKWSIEDDYFLGGTSHANYEYNDVPDKNSARFIDSVLNLPNLAYNTLEKVFKVTEKSDAYTRIEFREFDESQNDFGLEERFGDIRDNFYIAKKGNKIIFIVFDDEERRVIIKDQAEYNALAKKYEDKYGIKFDPYNNLIVTEQFCAFSYDGDDFEEFLDDPPGTNYSSGKEPKQIVLPSTRDSLYKIFSQQIRSLSLGMQVKGVMGLYFLKHNGRKIEDKEKNIITGIKRSGKKVVIEYAHGCLGYTANVAVKKLINRMESGRKLPEKWESHGKF